MKRDYNDPVYKRARLDVLKRDKHCCQMPNCGAKRRLHVHHIQPWSKAAYLRFETSNLITLCKKCHDLVTGKEHIYQPLLSGIANKNERNS